MKTDYSKLSLFGLLSLMLFAAGIHAQSTDQARTAEANFFDDKVSVSVPGGWMVDNHYKFRRMGIWQNNADSAAKEAAIMVSLTSKTNVNITNEMTHDFEAMRFIYPSATRGTFKADHPFYTVYSVAISSEDKIRKIDVYLDPGKESNYFVHLSMEYTKRAASKEELAAFLSVIKSATIGR
ncbi:MAG: hypothetical protein JWO06_921 [Bacteroidota bacterium]|nr:hypothetical protein [Bacteroidota bacterium]